jgi:transposase-like protein
MFTPPRCPNRSCSQHRRPRPAFFQRHGHYVARCRPWRIPRYRCKACRRTFSRQTFRADYHDHRPDLNAPLVRSIASGLGLRQTARNLRLSLRCCELKFRKLARHLRRLNLNLRGPLPQGSVLQFDEFETYETRRNTRPLSVPVLIEREQRFVVWAEAAPIRPRGKRSAARDRAIAEDELRFGKRRDLSARSVRRTLRRGAEMAVQLQRVVLETDEKTTYPAAARAAFGAERLEHRRTSSRLARMTWNPLFPINHTEAMTRDLMGRLRRESWLVSKKRRYLDLALQVFAAYRNYVRRRFNGDEESPAQRLGFVPRRMQVEELLSWRQDWGRGSIHPLSRRGASVESWRGARQLSA